MWPNTVNREAIENLSTGQPHQGSVYSFEIIGEPVVSVAMSFRRLYPTKEINETEAIHRLPYKSRQ